AFGSQGGTLLGGEFFESSDLDLRNKVDKILNSRPEFVLVVGRGSAMINACRQIREVNKEIRIYAGAGIDDPKIWQGLGSAGDSVVFARVCYDEQNPEFISVNEKFKSKYGYEMTWVNVYGYTIARYLSKGFSIAGKDKEKMRTYLRTLNFNSIRGQLVMNDNSDVVTPIKIFIRENSVSRQITAKKY
ncbi:MAG: ABC transporter substrate-binding protein, partial [Bacteroidota bacterium]|nr:ABC transporter substrate-binding protein [Bacteroidota bacterium]